MDWRLTDYSRGGSLCLMCGKEPYDWIFYDLMQPSSGARRGVFVFVVFFLVFWFGFVVGFCFVCVGGVLLFFFFFFFLMLFNWVF